MPTARKLEANAGRALGARYQCRQPEQTHLYQLVERYYPKFRDLMANQGRRLPDYVQEEFEAFLKCGRLEHGFLRVKCGACQHERLVAFSCKKRGWCPSCGSSRMADSAAHLVDEVLPQQPIRQWVLSVPFPMRLLFASYPHVMSKVLGIVYRAIATHLGKKAGFTRKIAQTGAVTLIQRFGSALNLNIHFHMLFLDGVYTETEEGKSHFHRVKAPTQDELQALVHQLGLRIGRYLERQGLIERDMENSYLSLEDLDDNPLTELHGHSITYRIAVGPNRGQKVFTLQTLPPDTDKNSYKQVGQSAGFSLHAGVMAEAHQRQKLERLCRYITRSAVSEQRLSLTSNGKVRYELKTPYRDGTTHVFFEPLDFIARLTSLVPRPRINLTRFHGVFAPNSKFRGHVTPAKRGKGGEKPKVENNDLPDLEALRFKQTWMQRLKRVFNIDLEWCQHCGKHGEVKVIACIEDPRVIEKILAHLRKKGEYSSQPQLALFPEVRGPPDLFSATEGFE